MEGLMVEHNPIELLVDRAKEGDRAAFDELVQIHQSRLKTFVQSRIGSDLKQTLDAEDVLQDAFVRSFELIDRFTWNGEESFFRWLAAIAGPKMAGVPEAFRVKMQAGRLRSQFEA